MISTIIARLALEEMADSYEIRDDITDKEIEEALENSRVDWSHPLMWAMDAIRDAIHDSELVGEEIE